LGHAIYFTQKNQANLMEKPTPSHPSPGHVQGRTLYTLISPGTELNHGFMQEHAEPRQTGYAAVFEVEQVGDAVAHIKVGDILMGMGPHQSFQHLPYKETIPVPEGMSPSEAVVVRLMNIGLTTLTTTSARPGERVIINGAGPVGLLAALLFKRCGYEVGVCEPNKERRELAASINLCNHWAQMPLDDSQWAERTALVLDCSGHEAAVLDGCRMVRRRGEVVLAGVPWNKRTDHSAHELLSLVFHRYAVLRSGWEWELPLHADTFSPIGLFENMHIGMKWLSESLLNLTRLTRIFLPEHAQAAYAGLAANDFRELFIVFNWKTQ
jgi:threonine dehydrogenase-like Zn-dependent dehydrogenase